MVTGARAPSFARDIQPLLCEGDRASMEFTFDLWMCVCIKKVWQLRSRVIPHFCNL